MLWATHSVFIAGVAGAAGASIGSSPRGLSDMFENINITDLAVHEYYDGSIQGVDFLLSGDNATNLLCSAASPGFPSPVITCGDTKYRFALYPGKDVQYALRIYHELGIG